MKRLQVLLCVSLLSLAATAQAQSKTPTGPPTVEEARAFLDRANADLLELGNEAARAGWVQATYITDDTEAIAAKANERLLTKTNELVIASRRFKGLKMPAGDGAEVHAAAAEWFADGPEAGGGADAGEHVVGRDVRQGQVLPAGQEPAKDCLGIEQIDVLMAKSRDPKELEQLWAGWHQISPPMRDKYARLVELSNQGAREFGFKDTGDLWRSGYDMTPAEFSAELERTWAQLEPLYKELHAYVRFKLIQKYGAAAERPDGMIPAHLLGNMWAQEWGNIYDIVAPAPTGRLQDVRPRGCSEAADRAGVGA